MDQWHRCTAEEALLGNDEKANCTEENKKFASRAVAYLVKHSNDGFVPLCASVATLLQERHRLKQEVRTLHEHICQLKKCKSPDPCIEQSIQFSEKNVLENSDQKSEYNIQNDNACSSSVSSEMNLSTEKVQSVFSFWEKTRTNKNVFKYSQSELETRANSVLPKGIFPLAECVCMQCLIAKRSQQSFLFCPLKLGDQIIIRGEILGEVKYVGHLDASPPSSVIFVGIQLDESVGNNDGSFCGKRYFFCPENFGMFVPLEDVCCVIR